MEGFTGSGSAQFERYLSVSHFHCPNQWAEVGAAAGVVAAVSDKANKTYTTKTKPLALGTSYWHVTLFNVKSANVEVISTRTVALLQSATSVGDVT